ncbi:MAG: PPC domain-containing protein, partial [Planctomycetales bacterium]|nr:PPC domain-containing protein [Planctomycetales bacterium]
GTEIDVTVSGTQMGDLQELVFAEPGLEVKAIEKVNDNAAKVKLAIAPECRLGIHAVWARTSTGISRVDTFHVGALPEMKEAEPNSLFEEPQAIPLGTVVNGVADNEDVDYYVVEAKKGERISVEIEALRLGRTFFDPYIAIFNAERFELDRSDDSTLLRQDGIVSVIAPEDGKYTILVRETSYRGNGACVYRLHVGKFPRPVIVYPAGGQPGTEQEIRWIGDVAGDRTEKIQIPAEPPKEFGLMPRDEHGVAPSACAFRVSPLKNVLEVEPNNQLAQATPFEAPAAVNGIISEPEQVDYFKFMATKDTTYDVNVYAREIRSPLDSVLRILNDKGGQIAANDDSGGPDSYVRFKAPADGEYVVEIRDHLKAGGPEYVYRVELKPVTPSLTMGIPDASRYVADVLTLPKGNRSAIMITAARRDLGGDLRLELAGLPPGVTAQVVEMPGNRNEVPVLLTAAADAAPKGALVDVIGRPVDENVKVEGHINQLYWLVRGGNNNIVWPYYADRMALGLVNEAPFSIEIVQPKVPIVRGGTLNLKVVAKRAEGFAAPIGVKMLYHSPGLSSSGSIKIEEGQSEAVIPITAAGNAEIKKWPIIVVAHANVGGADVRCASQMAELEVAEPMFAFSFSKGAVEQGQETNYQIEVENTTPFDGAAQVELLGLPPGAAVEGPLEMTKDTKQLTFKIKTDKDARDGRHKSLVCRAIVLMNGEPITHTLGTGELRVDKPLPPKVAAPAKPAAAPKPETVAAAPPQEKPLSRLEKLRLERAQAKAE